MRNQDEKSPVFLWYTTTHLPVSRSVGAGYIILFGAVAKYFRRNWKQELNGKMIKAF
jgi:hypothetical protein